MKCSCRFIRLVHHKDTWFSFAQNHPSMRRGLCLLWISDSIPYQPELQWPCDTVVEDIWASLLRTCSQSPNPISRYEQPLLWMIINGHRREKCYCWFEERWYETKTGEKEEVPSHLWERKKWYQASLPPAGRTFRHYKALSRCVIMLESPDGKGEGQDKCSNCLCNLNITSFVKFNYGRCDCNWHNWPWWLLYWWSWSQTEETHPLTRWSESVTTGSPKVWVAVVHSVGQPVQVIAGL